MGKLGAGFVQGYTATRAAIQEHEDRKTRLKLEQDALKLREETAKYTFEQVQRQIRATGNIRALLGRTQASGSAAAGMEAIPPQPVRTTPQEMAGAIAEYDPNAAAKMALEPQRVDVGAMLKDYPLGRPVFAGGGAAGLPGVSGGPTGTPTPGGRPNVFMMSGVTVNASGEASLQLQPHQVSYNFQAVSKDVGKGYQLQGTMVGDPLTGELEFKALPGATPIAPEDVRKIEDQLRAWGVVEGTQLWEEGKGIIHTAMGMQGDLRNRGMADAQNYITRKQSYTAPSAAPTTPVPSAAPVSGVSREISGVRGQMTPEEALRISEAKIPVWQARVEDETLSREDRDHAQRMLDMTRLNVQALRRGISSGRAARPMSPPATPVAPAAPAVGPVAAAPGIRPPTIADAIEASRKAELEQAAAVARAQAAARLGVERGPETPLTIPENIETGTAVGTTRGEATGVVPRTPEQAKATQSTKETENLVKQIEYYSRQLITAKTVMEAAYQRVRLWGGALTKANTAAAVYRDMRQAMLGVISRQIGGERGVLTDRDIWRIDAALPDFGDTADIRDKKLEWINSMVGTSKKAREDAITQVMGPKATGGEESKQQGFDTLPDASTMKDSILRDTKTGMRMRSDGTKWVPVR